MEPEIVEEELTPDPDFVRGYNDSCFLGEVDADLLLQLSAVNNPSTPYMDGFFCGKAHWQEQELQQLATLRGKMHEQEREDERSH